MAQLECRIGANEQLEFLPIAALQGHAVSPLSLRFSLAHRAIASWPMFVRPRTFTRLVLKEIGVGQIAAVFAKVTFNAGFFDDDRTDENHQFRFDVGVIAILEQITQKWDAPQERNFIRQIVDFILHQAAHHGYLVVFDPHDRFHFTRLCFRNLADDSGFGKIRIRIVDVAEQASDGRAHVQQYAIVVVDLRRHAHSESDGNAIGCRDIGRQC